MKKWQSLLSVTRKGAKFSLFFFFARDFDFFIFLAISREREETDGENEYWTSSLIHSRNIYNNNKEKDDAGEKDNWGSFVIEYSSSSFPVF